MRKKKKGGYAERLLGALHEAIAIERGEIRPAAISRRVITTHGATAPAAPAYSPRDVKEIRYKLELSQPVFAEALNVSPETVRAWEQGKKRPGGPAARLLEITKKHPGWVLASINVKY